MVWLCIAFSNPLDGGAPLVLSPAPRSLWAVLYPGEDFEGVLEKGQAVAPPGTHWRRAGNTFDELTLMPSVDYSAGGHWHGFVTKGTIS